LLLLLGSRRARQQADRTIAAQGESRGVEAVPAQLQVLAVAAPDVGCCVLVCFGVVKVAIE
jgi:hypothetical protein